MPSDDRDSSRDSERRLMHQHSVSSDHGRAAIPMWDSSDPDRAPPPLPLNPSSPSVTTRPNTSSAIQSAHAALAEKARENAILSSSTPPKRADTSPERSLIKGAAHNRMQSLQPGHVRDLSSFLEGGSTPRSPSRSSDKSGNRPSTPLILKELSLDMKSPEKIPSRSTTPTPIGRDMPTLRPSLRRPPQSILGENTPPQSATMLALQNMPARDVDSPLANVTNGSTAMIRAPQTFDAISNQILTLTSIATALQREMAQLSRRSKDNATDLLSLKEATNARDEDIRRSLRELASNLSEASSRSSSNFSAAGALLIDSRPHVAGSRAIKTVTLPRIPSPTSFARSMDRESLMGSPTPYHGDGVTTIALIEKILREMGTKEGQDLLVARLADVADRLTGEGMATAQKMEDLIQIIKDNSGSRAVIPSHSGGSGGNGTTRPRNLSFGEAPRLQLDFEYPRAGSMVSRVENLLSVNNKSINGSGNPRAADVINEDILKVIRTVKDGVAHGGGLTAEVKALVRDLRAEVLGMGREIGRKLDKNIKEDADFPSSAVAADKDFVASVVQDGLDELKQHMDRVMREARRHSSSSVSSRSTVDSREVYKAVRSAMAELQMAQQISKSPPESRLQKEDFINAVKEAWENYKPEIEVQHFGLERDELLACLKEGIQEFAPDTKRGMGGATRDEVFKAVIEGLKHFSPPPVETEASLTRDEIIDAFRECLEDFDFPTAQSTISRNSDTIRGDMLDAVREGLSTFEFPHHFGASASRDVGGQAYISDRLHEIVATLKAEFKAVSEEARQNVAAHGRDTEQLLDATKDGHEKLRLDMEAYIDRAAGIAGQREILQDIDDNFNSLRKDFEVLLSKGSASSLASVKRELELLRESMGNSVVPSTSDIDREDILRAFNDGLDNLRSELNDRPKGSNESILSGTGEILDALHDGLTGLRADVEKIGNKPVDMTVHHEILDTLRSGLEGVRADMDRMRESSQSEREVASVTNGAVITAEGINRNDIENLEVLITQLRIKVEALEAMPPPVPEAVPGMLLREDLTSLEETLRNVQDSVAGISARDAPVAEESVRREDFEAIETLLRNTKAKIDDMDPEQTVKRDHLDAVEDIVRETRRAVEELASRVGESPKREDVYLIEALIKEVVQGVEDIKQRAEKDADDVERVTKIDVQAVESACIDLKIQIEQMIRKDISILASKEDVKTVEEMVKEFKAIAESHADTNAKAFEERQAETVGVGERVSEIKSFLEEFKYAIKEKLDESTTGIDALGKLLEGLGDTINENSGVTDDIKSLFDTLKNEFEISNAGVVGVKLDSDEKFQKTWDLIEDQFTGVMNKYEEARITAESRAKEGDDVQGRMEFAMLSTKSVAEELKILIDTLGTTITESVDKMDEASKTIFNRVEETFTRVEETHADAKAEHQLTREQVFKTMTAVEGVHGHVADYQPKILESIKDVLLIVGQHYEHSKTSADALHEKIAEKAVHLPQYDQPMLKEAEKYDDGQVHEKLDKLVDQMHTAEKSFAQLDMLDKIHRQVMKTAAEVSDFVSAQTQRISNEHEDKEKAAEAATLALEKILAQKELLEAEVGGLREENDQLRDSLLFLKAEQEELARKKMRLSADVSSLETALHIRREELHTMEARAEGLERRILEGVLDHSRSLLMSKPGKGRDGMNLKRVPSQAASATASVTSGATSRSGASHTTQSAVDMAMSGARGAKGKPTKNPAGPSKRIFSLNQITNNVPAGGFKRSHSVRQSGGGGGLRKSSWGGSLHRNYGELNKENLAMKESEEESVEGDNVSEAGTMRKFSRGTVVTGTDVTDSIEEEYDETEGEYSESEVSARYDGGVVLYD